MPVRTWVMRTAVAFFWTFWPPGPLALKISIRSAFSSMCRSTSSASGSTATVAVEVWMRPLASVTGTRWMRWTPLSYLRREGGPRLLLRGVDGGLRLLDLLAGEGDHLGIAALFGDAAGAGQRLVQAAQFTVNGDDVLQRGVLAGESLQPLVVAGQLGAGHLAAQFFVSRPHGGGVVPP